MTSPLLPRISRVRLSGYAPLFKGPIDFTLPDTYRLSSEGMDALGSIRKNTTIDIEFTLAEEIAREIERRGWSDIVDLVYAEPTYVSARNRDDARSLRTSDPSENITLQIIRAFQRAWTEGPTQPVSPDCFVQIAFLVLDENRHSNEREKLTK